MEKKQINVRIPAALKRGVAIVAASLDYTQDDVATVAFATLFGTQDKELQARKEKIINAAHGLKLSFERAGRRNSSQEEIAQAA